MMHWFRTYRAAQDDLARLFCVNSRRAFKEVQLDDRPSASPDRLRESLALINVAGDDVVVWSGFVRSTMALYKKVRERRLTFYYLDHPYFYHPDYFEKYHETSHGKENRHLFNRRYFRCVRNGFNMTRLSDTSDAKFRYMYEHEALRNELTIEPWKKGGRHILVLPPSPSLYSMMELDPQTILDDALESIKKHTDREIRIRHKKTGAEGMNETDINVDIRDAFAVVSFGTSGAVKAVMQGVPSFCNEYSPVLPVSQTDFAKIETPTYPDREPWLFNLCNNQFSYGELERGDVNVYEYFEATL